MVDQSLIQLAAEFELFEPTSGEGEAVRFIALSLGYPALQSGVLSALSVTTLG